MVSDTALLNFTNRSVVMLVADVATRRPLSATLIPLTIEDVVATLQRHIERWRQSYSRDLSALPDIDQ